MPALLPLRILIPFTLACLLFALPDGVLRGQAPKPGDFAPDEVLVQVERTRPFVDLPDDIKRDGARVEREVPEIEVRVVKVPAGRVPEFVNRLRNRPGIRFAEPNRVVRAILSPNDSAFAQQWALPKIQAPQGWDVYPGSFATAGSGVIVAVVDTGIQSSHPDLDDGRVRTDLGARCLNTPCQAGNTDDDNGHGTLIAGIIAAETNNSTGVAGLAFNAHLMPVKALDKDGSGFVSDVANGIIWAKQNGAKVINLSLGAGYEFNTTLCTAAQQAVDAGIVVVSVTGNDNKDQVEYPGACPAVIAVGGSTQNDTRWSSSASSGSNYGPQLWVVAPAQSVLTTYINSGYAFVTGTSAAAPHVSALAALLIGQGSVTSPADIKKRLASSADKIGGVAYGSDPNNLGCNCTWHNEYGYGRINVFRALNTSPAFPRIAKPAVIRGKTWYLRNSLTTGVADFAFTYGNTGDVPLLCDWSGHGNTTPGVVRNNPGYLTWYVRNSTTSGIADFSFNYGAPGDTPLCGDWDGNGIETPGVVRSNAGYLTWYLRNSNTTGIGEFSFSIGLEDDQVLVCAWDPTQPGKKLPVIVRQNPGYLTWYLYRSYASGREWWSLNYGAPGDTPLCGDWDGDGVDTPGVVRSNAGYLTWYLRNSNTTGIGEFSFNYGAPGDIPRVWK